MEPAAAYVPGPLPGCPAGAASCTSCLSAITPLPRSRDRQGWGNPGCGVHQAGGVWGEFANWE